MCFLTFIPGVIFLQNFWRHWRVMCCLTSDMSDIHNHFNNNFNSKKFVFINSSFVSMEDRLAWYHNTRATFISRTIKSLYTVLMSFLIVFQHCVSLCRTSGISGTCRSTRQCRTSGRRWSARATGRTRPDSGRWSRRAWYVDVTVLLLWFLVVMVMAYN